MDNPSILQEKNPTTEQLQNGYYTQQYTFGLSVPFDIVVKLSGPTQLSFEFVDDE